MTTTIETMPIGDVTEAGELLGEVRGVRFYRLAVIAAVRPDSQIDRITPEAEWRRTLEAELLAARARIAELEQRKAGAKPGPKPGARRQLALPAPVPVAAPTPTPARFPEADPPTPPTPTPGGRFGNEGIAPRVPPPPVVTPPPERHPCPTCRRVFDSVDSYNRHVPRCAPAPVVVETPPDPVPAIEIPADPDAAALELARLSEAPFPRPCPECWKAGFVHMIKGPAGMASHRKTAHGVLPNIGTPVAARWPDGGVCRHCGSGVFARSFDDDTVCVRCAKEGPPPQPELAPSGRRKVASSA